MFNVHKKAILFWVKMTKLRGECRIFIIHLDVYLQIRY